MRSLIVIEWIKMKKLRAFWVLLGIFGFAWFAFMLKTPSYISAFQEEVLKGAELPQGVFTIFNADEIWPYITYISRFYLPFLSFLVVLLVASEYTHNTLKQHIIDGMSILDFLKAKAMVVTIFTLFFTVILVATSFYLSLRFGEKNSFNLFATNLAFVPAFMLQVLGYLSLSVLLTLWLKKSILAFGILLAYSFPIEIIIRRLVPPDFRDYFPINSIMSSIPNPFKILSETDIPVAINYTMLAIGFGYIIIFWLLSYWRLSFKKF